MDTASRSRSASGATLAAYVGEQLEARLRKAAFELRDAREAMNEDNVHDLRVALRRFMESVQVAKGILPKEGVKTVMGDLKKIMKDAGVVRSCDIAAKLLRAAGAPDDAPVLHLLAERRTAAEQKLYRHAHRAYRRSATLAWRKALGLHHLRPHHLRPEPGGGA